jgi:hypothetical protein
MIEKALTLEGLSKKAIHEIILGNLFGPQNGKDRMTEDYKNFY